MILDERTHRAECISQAVNQMMIAARTAPKAKGVDIIEIATLTGEEKQRLAQQMQKESEKRGMKFFLRDAENVEMADAVLLIGTKKQTMGLNCSYCGYASCEEMKENVNTSCAFNSVDLGIAIGSACATASDLRLDTRVMYSVGISALGMGLLKGCSMVFAILISVSSKNPFFDRKSYQ